MGILNLVPEDTNWSIKDKDQNNHIFLPVIAIQG